MNAAHGTRRRSPATPVDRRRIVDMIAATLALTLLLLAVTMFGPGREPVDVRAGDVDACELSVGDAGTFVVTVGEPASPRPRR